MHLPLYLSILLTASAAHVPLQPRVGACEAAIQDNEGDDLTAPTADGTAGLGVEFESGAFFFINDDCSNDDTNAAKKQVVGGRTGTNWILTADTGGGAGRLNAEYIFDGQKIKVGSGGTQALSLSRFLNFAVMELRKSVSSSRLLIFGQIIILTCKRCCESRCGSCGGSCKCLATRSSSRPVIITLSDRMAPVDPANRPNKAKHFRHCEQQVQSVEDRGPKSETGPSQIAVGPAGHCAHAPRRAVQSHERTAGRPRYRSKAEYSRRVLSPRRSLRESCRRNKGLFPDQPKRYRRDESQRRCTRLLFIGLILRQSRQQAPPRGSEP
jgi:hypothetical protein